MNNGLISKNEVKKLGATCLARRNEDGQLEAIISLDLAPSVSLPITTEGDMISRSALRKDFVDRYHKAEDWITKAEDIFIKTRAEATRDFIGEVIMTIDFAQTVEPVCPYLSDDEVKQPCLQAPCERQKGKWIAIAPYTHETFCPYCKEDSKDERYGNFCPNCGADMRGGAE